MGLFGALLSHSSVYACIRRTRRGLASMRPILLVGPPNPHQPTMDDHTKKTLFRPAVFLFHTWHDSPWIGGLLYARVRLSTIRIGTEFFGPSGQPLRVRALVARLALVDFVNGDPEEYLPNPLYIELTYRLILQRHKEPLILQGAGARDTLLRIAWCTLAAFPRFSENTRS